MADYNRRPGVSVKDAPFYARGNGTTDDTAAIQAAIDAVATSRGGRVIFPPGEYRITSPLVLPRQNQLAIELVGMGVLATTLYANTNDLASDEPLISWESENAPAWRFRLSHMTVARADAGKVLRHDTPFGGNDRWMGCSIHDVAFQSGGTTETMVELSGILRCDVRNVSLQGGAVALQLSGSHLTTYNIHTIEDHTQVCGIDISGGGNMTLVGTRIEACEAGPCVKIRGGATHILFDGLWCEGKHSTPVLDIQDAEDVIILQPAFGGPTVSGARGIKIGAACRHIRVLGGELTDYTGQSGYALEIEAGARHVHVEGDVSFAEDNFLVGAVQNVHVIGYPGGERYRASYGVIDVTDNVTSVSTREVEAMRLSFSFAGEVDTLTNGREGQQFTLFFENGNATILVTGNIRTRDGNPFVGAANQSITFMFDGTNWREIARAA